MNRLFVDLKENCHGEITGPVKFPADGAFTLEALATVLDVFADSYGLTASEVAQDLHAFIRMRNCGTAIT